MAPPAVGETAPPYEAEARSLRSRKSHRTPQSQYKFGPHFVTDGHIALDFIQTHLKVRQFNLCLALFISRGPQTGKLMYKRIYMIALDFKFTIRSRGAARDHDFFLKNRLRASISRLALVTKSIKICCMTFIKA